MNHDDSASNSIAAGRDARDTRVGKILNEFLDRRASGELVSEAALLAQHPDLAGELRECLELVRDLQPPADRIDALIAQGVLSKSADPRYLAELGLYKITDFIGRGGMGVVLKAYEESLDRAVALKILRPELADDGGALTRFEREAKAAAALRHPNIVTVYAIGQERGSHFIAMEYVAGPSLAEVISCQRSAVSSQPSALSGQPSADVASGLRAGRTEPRPSGSGREGEAPAEPSVSGATGGLSTSAATPQPLGRESFLGPELIRTIFRQLLSALTAAHEAGLIHRDVKSSNILLDGWFSEGPRVQGAEGPREETTERAENMTSGAPCHVVTLSPCHAAAGVPPACVKLADFGLARVVAAETRMTMPHAVLGTPEYMSPEQARGDENIDHRTDLYSAGVVLYEMLTGRTPFHADTPTATIHQILHDDPPDPRKLDKNVNPALSTLALRLMAKDPDDRLASAEEAINLLEAGNPVGSLETHRRVRRRILAATFGLPLVAGGAWLAWQLALRRRPITGVKVDEGNPTRVLVERGYGRWEELHTFPDEVGAVTRVEKVDLDGAGTQAIVAGLLAPLNGSNIFAFDAWGGERWRLNVANVFSGKTWPDCMDPVNWSCAALKAGELDGSPGDELIVIASDSHEYPTRVSLVDPRTGVLGSTFWHFGQFKEKLLIQPDFFGAGRPALILWGLNNKLDGFDEALPGHSWPVTSHDIVSVLVILDPRRMEGLGPPRTDRIPEIPVAKPFAYAFLDMAYRDAVRENDSTGEMEVPPRSEVANIEKIECLPYTAARADSPRFRVVVGRDEPGGANLTVDSDLNLINAERSSAERYGSDEGFWRARWRPIIQNGRYVDE